MDANPVLQSKDGAPPPRRRKDETMADKEQQRKVRRQRAAHQAYGRGSAVNVETIKDKKLRRNLGSLETKYQTAALRAKDAEMLLERSSGFLELEHELERTYRVRQDEIQESAGIDTAQKKFDLDLDNALGPYVGEYTRNGRELLLTSRRGHVATMDWRAGKLGCEMQLGETVRDAHWLHNNQFFALAQKEHVYIYDRDGVELHCLRQHREPTHLEFLPYHFLLASLSSNGFLKYQDVSTGQLVAEIHTRQGQPVSLAQNPYNAILHVGHQNGTVTLWSPNSSEALVKLLAHRGPVRAIAMDREGRYMVSTGQDSKMAVWDIRMFKELHNHFTRAPASSVAISDTGLTAVGWGTRTTVWKGLFSKYDPRPAKVQAPYMAWGGEGKAIERVRWCPFEDVLGVGHHKGFSSVIIPGAGEANFDALEANPLETAKQRQEAEVKGLLNKLQPEMIALDPNFVGNLDLRSEKQRQAEWSQDAEPVDVVTELRDRARGKNSALKRFMRKQKKRNIIDEKKLRMEEILKEQQARRNNRAEEKRVELGPALARFARKE